MGLLVSQARTALVENRRPMRWRTVVSFRIRNFFCRCRVTFGGGHILCCATAGLSMKRGLLVPVSDLISVCGWFPCEHTIQAVEETGGVFWGVEDIGFRTRSALAGT